MAGFLLYANLYIALCAVMCTAGTLHIFGIQALKGPLPAVTASSVIIIYNLHYYYSGTRHGINRQQWYARHKTALFLLMVAALAVWVFFSVQLNTRQLLIVAVTGLLALLYSLPLLPGKKRLNQYGLMKILVLSLCWTVFTTWWPVAGRPVHLPFLWLLLAQRWLFFIILCLLLDIRDAAPDAARGVQTLPVRMGTAAAYRLCAWLTVVLALLNTVHAVQGHPPALFNAFFLTTLLTGFMVWLCRRQPQPLTWLLGIDGLLLAHGLLLMAV